MSDWPTDPLHAWGAADLLRAYACGAVSPVEVIEDVLRHVAVREPALHALWELRPDAARAAARASEARWRQGRPQRCAGHTLDGLPLTLKENIATRGCALPLGTAATLLQAATEDAPPAARLAEAGAILLAKTTMPDYGMLSSGLSSFHALARNPWSPDRNPGGSSAGAAVAAAAGYGPLHLGTDIGGSVRLPAAWCGLVALKPSLGRIPIHPPYMGRVAGPMTRCVDDAAHMMGPLCEPDARDATSLPPQRLDWTLPPDEAVRDGLRGLRVGLWLEPGAGLPLDPAIRRAVQAAARRFEAAGAHVTPLEPWLTPEMLAGMDRFWRVRSALDLAALPAERRARVLPFIRAWAAAGEGLSGAQVFEAYSQTFVLKTATVAATAAFDLVLSPVSPVRAFAAEAPNPTGDPTTALEHIAYTVPFSMSEQPAAAIACGLDDDGLPIGLQIAGRRFDDLGVMRAARAWELLRDPLPPWPFQGPRNQAGA